MTTFTRAGKRMAQAEPIPEPHPLGGATAHMHACQHDAGLTIVLIGKESNGRRFTKHAKSVYGAFMTMEACWGLNNAWLVDENGKRTLLMRRY